MIYTKSNIILFMDLSKLNNDYFCQNLTLYNNYSNPFRPWKIIKYSVPVGQNIEPNVYNVRGGLIKNLFNTPNIQGVNLIKWDATDNLGKRVPAGIFLNQIKSNDKLQKKKKVLSK